MNHSYTTRRDAWLACSLLVGLSALAAGCDIPLYRATETLTDAFPSSDSPTVTVETFNGSIDISNGNSDEVVVEVTKRASGFDQHAADRNLDNIKVTMHAENRDKIIVRVERRGAAAGDSGASIILAVPPQANARLKSSNGYIVSEGLRGKLDAETSNAKINIVDAGGTIKAETSNGPILIEAQAAQINASTSNSGVRFRGTLTDSKHEFETSNGPIDVRLPADSQFSFVAETSNGDIDVEFDYEGDAGRRRRRKASGTVGNAPKFSLELETSNSSIAICKDH